MKLKDVFRAVFVYNEFMKKMLRGLLTVMICLLSVSPDFFVLAAEEPVFHYELGDDGSAVITGIEKAGDTLVIPSEIDGHPVTVIAAGSLDCTEIAELTIPDSVVTVGEGAFANCGLMNKLTWPVSCTGRKAFEEMNELAILHLTGKTGVDYASVEDTPWYDSRYGLRDVIVSEGVERIGNNSFAGFLALNAISFPDSLREIGEQAFYNCFSLGEIILPAAVSQIGSGAFGLDEAVTASSRMILAQSLQTIGEQALGERSEYICYRDSEAERYLIDNHLAHQPIDLRFTEEKAEMALGELRELTMVEVPPFVYDEIRFASSDPEILNVYPDGSVRALALGEADVIAASRQASCVCHVTVSDEAGDNVRFLRMKEGQKLVLSPSSDFSDLGGELTYRSQKGLLSVNKSGRVTAEVVCCDYIEVTGADASACYKIEVYDPADKLVIEEKKVIISQGNDYGIKAHLTGKNSDRKLVYYSDDDTVATVNRDGKITAVGFGTATIRAVSRDESGLSGSIEVTIPAQKMTVTPKAMPLMKGKKFQFRITKYGELAFFSSDESICTVNDSGVVTAHEIGEATITIGSKDGRYVATVPVSVIEGFSYGVDVSTFQYDLSSSDWQKMKNFGIDFAIIREGYGTSRDVRFEKNYARARQVGVKVGVYHYLNAGDNETALKEAESFLKNIAGKKFEYPVCLDIEAKAQKQLSDRAFNEIIDVFCAPLVEKGYKVAIYSSMSVLTRVNSENRAKYDLWSAQWDVKTASARVTDVKIWQFTSSGKVPGSDTRMDMDICFFDYPSYMKEHHLNGY